MFDLNLFKIIFKNVSPDLSAASQKNNSWKRETFVAVHSILLSWKSVPAISLFIAIFFYSPWQYS